MAKHFVLKITDNSFSFEINQEKLDAEAALDGLYVVRGSVSSQRMASSCGSHEVKNTATHTAKLDCVLPNPLNPAHEGQPQKKCTPPDSCEPGRPR